MIDILLRKKISMVLEGAYFFIYLTTKDYLLFDFINLWICIVFDSHKQVSSHKLLDMIMI